MGIPRSALKLFNFPLHFKVPKCSVCQLREGSLRGVPRALRMQGVISLFQTFLDIFRVSYPFFKAFLGVPILV